MHKKKQKNTFIKLVNYLVDKGFRYNGINIFFKLPGNVKQLKDNKSKFKKNKEDLYFYIYVYIVKNMVHANNFIHFVSYNNRILLNIDLFQ